LENIDPHHAGSFPVPSDNRLGAVFYSEIRPVLGGWIGDAANKDCQEYSAAGYYTKFVIYDFQKT
jgi:hypothetical protein